MINISERLKEICSLLLRLDPSMTNLKLQKLLYFIQASSLIYLGEPAFVDKIEAWQYGPVVPNAYNEYRFNFDNLIKHKEIENNNLCELIHIIYKHLGKYTSYDLVNLTHSYASWKDTWNREVGGVINIHDIIVCHVEISKKKNGFIF